MRKVCCIICEKEYSIKGIHTHYDRTHLKKTHYSSGNNGKYQEISERIAEKKLEEERNYLQNPNKCECCSSILPFSKMGNKFCSSSCSAKYNNLGRKHSLETKKKISKSSSVICKIHFYECIGCNEIKSSKRKRKYCSKECRKNYKRKFLTDKERYRKECQFTFNLKDYPEKFDFSLIEKYGWYKAPNKGNNPNGVSRDHMISIDYGWRNNIPSNIISHPANCELLPHKKNYDKRTNCSLTLEDLLERIKQW